MNKKFGTAILSKELFVIPMALQTHDVDSHLRLQRGRYASSASSSQSLPSSK